MKAQEIQALARAYRVHPSRAMGQNFLIDDTVAKKIVSAAALARTETVVEIGPGFGALTAHVRMTGARFIAIEKDRRLAQYLEETVCVLATGRKHISLPPSVTLVIGDALRFPIARTVSGPYVLIGNLPYHITSPLIAHFFEDGPSPERAVVMVQKEVADRMAAAAPDMNALALAVQLRYRIERLFTVAPHAFWPQPEVDSCVVRLTRLPQTRTAPLQSLNASQLLLARRLARIAFSHKRKQLFSTLLRARVAPRDALEKAFVAAGLAAQETGAASLIRPEAVDIAAWQQLVLYLDKILLAKHE